jgi:two-component system, chemotaxis family, protein-glutamate methylesterase/glutaminase
MSAVHQYAVVIGSSAGGIETLKRLVAGLPADFAAPVFIVQHLPPAFPSFLPQILTTAGKLDARHPRDGERIDAPGIYVAPPDHHLLIEDGHVAVKRGPKENGFRPSVDALFRSAAYIYRSGAIGVVLSGALNDGTSGLWTIKRLGGTTIVQDPADATNPSMPQAALNDVEIDCSVPAARIAEVLMEKIMQPQPSANAPPADELRCVDIERAIAGGAYPLDTGVLDLGAPSRYSCPECHGVLARIDEGPLTRYRCHTGHGYTQDALLSGIEETSDETLAQTVTALEEGAMLLEEIGARCRHEANTAAADDFLDRARRTKELVRGLQDLLHKGRTALT